MRAHIRDGGTMLVFTNDDGDFLYGWLGSHGPYYVAHMLASDTPASLDDDLPSRPDGSFQGSRFAVAKAVGDRWKNTSTNPNIRAFSTFIVATQVRGDTRTSAKCDGGVLTVDDVTSIYRAWLMHAVPQLRGAWR